jgi:hypothetical protein
MKEIVSRLLEDAMRHKTHVLIPFTTQVACGAPNHTANAGYREQVTCKLCRKTDEYKRLPNRPRRFRKGG